MTMDLEQMQEAALRLHLGSDLYEWLERISQMSLIRNKNGTFKRWTGGITRGKYTSFNGTMVHIGKEFARQHGRAARVGEIVRKKNQNGIFNQNAEWYVKTGFGWRKVRTGPGKPRPTSGQVGATIRNSRPGR